MHIFITGINSFIGEELCKQLKKKNINFTGIDVVKNYYGKICDIRNKKIVKLIPKKSIVIHLAALSHHGICKKQPKKVLDVNINGTINLLNASSKRKVKQFIFASSEWVYGEKKNNYLFDENHKMDIFNLNSNYAISKSLAETILLKNFYAFPMTILRFGITYGSKNKNSSAVESVLKQIKTKKYIKVGSLHSARKFIHVSDLARGIISTLGRKRKEIFNIAGKELISIKKIIQVSELLLNKKIKILETNKKKFNIRNLSINKAKKILKWQPEIGIKEGIKRIIND